MEKRFVKQAKFVCSILLTVTMLISCIFVMPATVSATDASDEVISGTVESRIKADVLLSAWTSTEYHYWSIQPVVRHGETFYRIVNTKTELAMAYVDGEIALVEPSGHADELWSFISLPNTGLGNAYNIKNVATGTVLALQDGVLSMSVHPTWAHQVALFFFSDDTDAKATGDPASGRTVRIFGNRKANALYAENIQVEGQTTSLGGFTYTAKDKTHTDDYVWTLKKHAVNGTVYYQIINYHTGNAIADFNGTAGQATPAFENNQLWKIFAITDTSNGVRYNIVNKATGNFLLWPIELQNPNVAEWSAANATFKLYDLVGSTLLTLEDGIYFHLGQMWGSNYIGAEGKAATVESNVNLVHKTASGWGNSAEYHWTVRETSNGGKTYYQFVNKLTGLAMATTRESNAVVQVEPDLKDSTQLWCVVGPLTVSGLGSGYYNLYNKANGGFLFFNDSGLCAWKIAQSNASWTAAQPLMKFWEDAIGDYSAPADGKDLRLGINRGTSAMIYAAPDSRTFNGTVYISEDGNDYNDGLTEDTPLKTIAGLNKFMAKNPKFGAGSSILLRKGDSFTGTITLSNLIGSAEAPITIGSYGTAEGNPVINAPEPNAPVLSADNKAAVDEIVSLAGATIDTYEGSFEKPADTDIGASIVVNTCQYVEIKDIDCASTNDGVRYYSNQLNPNGLIEIVNTTGLNIKNINLEADVTEGKIKEYNADMNGVLVNSKGTTFYPYQGNEYFGILVTGAETPVSTDMQDIVIENITASSVTAAINMGAAKQFTIKNSTAKDMPNWGFIFNKCSDGQVIGCTVDNSGFGKAPNGNAAFMVISSQNLVFDDLYATNIHKGEYDLDGVAFDFEGGINQNNITLINSEFDEIDGSAIMIFWNTDGNQNIKIENVKIRNYNQADIDAPAINLLPKSGDPAAYTNTVAVSNTVIWQSGYAAYYNGYDDSSKDLLVYNGVTFTDCSFVSESACTDVTGDGKVNILDIIRMKRMCSEGEKIYDSITIANLKKVLLGVK